jgi:Protein of unknown function (DUF3489)
MAKSTKKRTTDRSKAPVSTPKPLSARNEPEATKEMSAASVRLGAAATASDSSGTAKPTNSDTKQSRVLEMLRSPAGATVAAMMQATGWQQHSVRGFLAGVVRKRLKLKLTSKTVDGKRVYQIASGGNAKTNARQPKRRAA